MDNPDEIVNLSLPRSLVEHIGYLVEINHGAWSGLYNALRPYLLEPSVNPAVCVQCLWPVRIGHHADCPYRTDFS